MRLLILCTSQFGYHLDTYYYCKYGRATFDITYMGFEGNRPMMTMDGICINLVSYKGNKVIRFMRWCWAALRESRKGYDIVFIKYFPGCSLLRLITPKGRFVFDIRTGSIQRSCWRRWMTDRLMVLESKAFKQVTVISENLARKLGLSAGRYHILPLGADVLADNDKQFNALHLLYVGTLSGRDIEKTLIGFEKFHRHRKDNIEMTYTIAGDGYRGELDQLRNLAGELGLENVVKFLGFVNHDDLAPFWQECNVGVSFIPINEIYDVQPSTKTFEYLLAGMPVIATGTLENRRIVNRANGVIILDTADGFTEGLERILLNPKELSSPTIRKSVENSKWENIINFNLYPFLNKIINK